MLELASFRTIHVVGAGGAGMRGIAMLLAGLGHSVTGSDVEASRYLNQLDAVGIETWVGHRPERAGQWDLVVASSAVPRADPELAAAAALAVPVWERPQLLAALTIDMPAVGVAGTHGKTTCTAMAVTALLAVGEDPSFLVGGELVDHATGARLADRALFALEADEAFGTFIDLELHGLLVTNVEVDHLDYYGTADDLEQAFLDVATKVDGPLVVGIDGPGGRRLAGQTAATTYGTSAGADWVIGDVEHGRWQVTFVMRSGAREQRVMVPKPGIHVARNATGVLALLDRMGYDLAKAADGLAAFGGVRRRHEIRAEVGGVTIVDDYAHHPTELAATIAAAGSADWNRVWAVFQPHRYSRTAEHAAQFGAALTAADRIVVTDVYPAGEEPIPGLSGDIVAAAAREAGADEVDYLADRAALADYLSRVVTPGDLVLLLGAGDITSVADELAVRLGGLS